MSSVVQTKPELDVKQAYELAYGQEWDNNLPPDAVSLAALREIKSPTGSDDSVSKLREYAGLAEQQFLGPNRQPVHIEKDWRYKLNAARVLGNKKLKEMTLSSQAFAVAEVNRVVWEALKPNLIFRELVTVWHTNNPTFRFIRAILMPRAFDVGEGTEVRIAGERYDYIDVNMRKIGVRPTISREMVEDAQWDVVARQLAEGGRAMAQKENELGLAILNTQGTSSNNYQGWANTIASANSAYIAYPDLVGAIGTLRENNAFPDTAAVYPSEEADLLNDDKFIHSFYFGGLAKKAMGPPDFFGQVLGIRTLTSTLVTAGNSLVIDTARAAGFVIRRDVTVENLVDPIKDVSGAVFTERMNLGVLRAPAICQITVSNPTLP
jgi:hypothetical protein